MSPEFVLHTGWFRFGKPIGQKRCLNALPMYCLVLNFSSYLICILDILGLFQKMLDRWLSIFGL